jgi:NAD(P)-dependent dehydrogenase (short-subunit alcohol dehydrogenase family)
MGLLTERVVLVSGGTQGVGAGVARAAAREGATVVVTGRRRADGADAQWLDNVIAASAEGYPVPTNLDRDPPVDGLAPPSQADLVRQALAEGWNPRVLRDALRAGADRRTS